jgi:hypothetical protein
MDHNRYKRKDNNILSYDRNYRIDSSRTSRFKRYPNPHTYHRDHYKDCYLNKKRSRRNSNRSSLSSIRTRKSYNVTFLFT